VPLLQEALICSSKFPWPGERICPEIYTKLGNAPSERSPSPALGGPADPQEWSVRGSEKNATYPYQEFNPGRPGRRLVATVTDIRGTH